MYDMPTKTRPVAACWMRLWRWRSDRSCLTLSLPLPGAVRCRIYLAVKICSNMMRNAESTKRPMRPQPLESPLGAEAVADLGGGSVIVEIMSQPAELCLSNFVASSFPAKNAKAVKMSASGRTKNGTSVRISCQCQAMPSITLSNIDRWRSSPFRSNKMSAEVSIRRDALHMHAFCTWYHFATFVLTQLPRNFPFRPVHFLSEFGTLLLGATRNVQ